MDQLLSYIKALENPSAEELASKLQAKLFGSNIPFESIRGTLLDSIPLSAIDIAKLSDEELMRKLKNTESIADKVMEIYNRCKTDDERLLLFSRLSEADRAFMLKHIPLSYTERLTDAEMMTIIKIHVENGAKVRPMDISYDYVRYIVDLFPIILIDSYESADVLIGWGIPLGTIEDHYVKIMNLMGNYKVMLLTSYTMICSKNDTLKYLICNCTEEEKIYLMSLCSAYAYYAYTSQTGKYNVKLCKLIGTGKLFDDIATITDLVSYANGTVLISNDIANSSVIVNLYKQYEACIMRYKRLFVVQNARKLLDAIGI